MSNILTAEIAAIHRLPSMTGKIFRQFIAASGEYEIENINWLNLGADLTRATKLHQEIVHLDVAGVSRQLAEKNISLIRLSQPDYPQWLAEIPSPPPLLYIRGRVTALSTTSLAVVGTRRPTEYGLAMTRTLVESAASAGLTIVSGLAYGIDAAAHQTALKVGGSTVAVLGCGLDRVYPAEHYRLAEDIINHGGAVISEFPLGAEPERHHFPQRNRIISGLSRAVLLIEAGEKSGALITAKFAVDQNREVLAVPGPATWPLSIGPNNWIKLGAKMVTAPADILDVFALQQQTLPEPKNFPDSTDPMESAILNSLRAGSLHIDAIADQSRLDSNVIAATLSLLEIRGLVEHLGGMMYGLAS